MYMCTCDGACVCESMFGFGAFVLPMTVRSLCSHQEFSAMDAATGLHRGWPVARAAASQIISRSILMNKQHIFRDKSPAIAIFRKSGFGLSI